jgi:hypothetical protein
VVALLVRRIVERELGWVRLGEKIIGALCWVVLVWFLNAAAWLGILSLVVFGS